MPKQSSKKRPSNEYGVPPVNRLEWLLALAKDERFIPTDVEIGVFLQSLVNRERGYAFPSYEYLEKISGYSRASIARSIKRLREAGAIRTKPQGRDRPLKYWLVAPKLWARPLTTETSLPAKTSHPQAEEVSDVGTRDLTSEMQNSLNEPIDKHIEILSEIDFMDVLIEADVFESFPEPEDGATLLARITRDHYGLGWKKKWSSVADAEANLERLLGPEAMTCYWSRELCALANVLASGDGETPLKTLPYAMERKAKGWCHSLT